jgi:hypothetical protein
VEGHQPEQRYEVFIGSTKKDFERFRRELIAAVIETGNIPNSMELWTSVGVPVREIVTSSLESSDIHILLVGARYGEVIEGLGMSYTEWEYVQSRDAGRPVLTFLLDERDLPVARETAIAQDPKEAEPLREAMLASFRRKLTAENFVHNFRNDEDDLGALRTVRITSLHRVIRSPRMRKNAGCIRASNKDVIRGREIRENPFLSRTIDRLAEFTTLTARVVKNKAAKETAAATFWDHMADRIIRRGFKGLFFESGSTLAYVSEAFEKQVLEKMNQRGEWTVWTNNVETLLQLTCQTDETTERFPSAAPDPGDPYGAMFPREWRKIRKPPPEIPRPLYPDEHTAVQQLRAKLPNGDPKTLYLATTSGLDLEHEEAYFRGPHVGSHANMLFKRALLTSKAPVVLFLDAEKLGSPFQVGRCYPVFDSKRTWLEVRRRYPLAVCVGWEEGPHQNDAQRAMNDPKRIAGVLTDLGFDNVFVNRSSENGRAGALVFANAAFVAHLPTERLERPELESHPSDQNTVVRGAPVAT